jgi:ribosomal protein L17
LGGRPRGSKNRKTLIRERAEQLIEDKRLEFNQAVAEKARALLDRQVEITQQSENYSAANSAIDSLLDRAFGRPSPRLEQVSTLGREPVTIVNVYAPGTEPHVVKLLNGRIVDTP